jgi:DNA polymerase-3 subunit alpha
VQFSHLHVHTQFSLLDGAASISELYKKAVKDNMRGIAITDHGNMFGVFKFVAEASKHNTNENPNVIKPIVGCEFYLVADRSKKQFTKDDKDIRYHQLFLAKNPEGYRNLVKLCSLGYTDGLYGKYPRIDKELVLKYHKGLVASTCCLGASVPRTILRKGEQEGEKEFKWWLDLFGEDYYIELQRHDIPEQNIVNEVLLKFAVKYKVKVIASNDSHYVDREDSNAHDILLCINTGSKQSDEKIKDVDDDVQVKTKQRFAFYNDQFYFKTTEEMATTFSDIPHALDNTNEIVDKVETLKLKQDILLPHFKIPEGFTNQDEYLKHLTYQGAKKRYGDSLDAEIETRVKFELFTIQTMGFAGYFLIVADFINHGKNIGVFVGPGRGSAAGSVVAYCTGITNIDPIKYNLLFERFLNPDRKSMPDIDTDFDDEGRQKVIDYVVEKYGKNQVAQIVTYGTMAAKSSIKDVARVLDLPLPDSNALAKLVPDRPGVELNRLIKAAQGDKSLGEYLTSDDIEGVRKLRSIYEGNDLHARVLREAVILEGSVRNTGIHAAGIIIAPKDLTEIIPVYSSKETELLITQFDGKVIEDSGVIKMDFLGLKTLTIIRDALELIKRNHGIEIDIDNILLDDNKTFELYQRGDTNGTFQFESIGMQKYLKELKPDKFEDLIAMNALFRPGPMEYIPNYIRRKHKIEPIAYDLPEMEEHLRETYGITVYQEQVMLLSQRLANFSKGDADVLRKAMGKKDRATLDKMKSKFIAGIQKNKLNEKVAEKIWTDWEAFAQYAFNKSHSTCYALVAFQTAYLKAHYPAEYMSAVLTHHLSNIDKITFFMEECRKMGIPVIGPDINESEYKFAVNKAGQIRFGLGAIKGVGEAAVNGIIEERANGSYTSIFDLTKRVNNKASNKKTLESLAMAGAFDCFKTHRAQYFAVDGKDPANGIERAIRFGNAISTQASSMASTLFGDDKHMQISTPVLAQSEPWTKLDELAKEKEVIGFYISGHPLDDYKFEIDNFCTHNIQQLKDLEKLKNKEISFAGIITDVNHRISQAGKPFGSLTVEDFTGSVQLMLFGENYGKMKEYLVLKSFLYIKAKVQNRYKQPDQWEISPLSIQYLSDITDKLTKTFTLKISISSVSEKFISHVNTLIASSPGQSQLKFNIVDSNDNIALDLPSKKMRVKVNRNFIESLRQLEDVEWKVN